MKQFLFCSSLISICLFVGCKLPFIDEPDYSVCYDSNEFLDISVISLKEMDSVNFFVDDRQFCAGMQKKTYCRQKLDINNEYYIGLMGDKLLNGCLLEEDKRIWTVSSCFLRGPIDDISMNSEKLKLKIFIGEETLILETNPTSWWGGYLNIIAEEDTTDWFSFDENPFRPWCPEYNHPAKSIRGDCVNGFCFAYIKYDLTKFCYE